MSEPRKTAWEAFHAMDSLFSDMSILQSDAVVALLMTASMAYYNAARETENDPEEVGLAMMSDLIACYREVCENYGHGELKMQLAFERMRYIVGPTVPTGGEPS